ncbi:hypothetical protein PENSPDRAFT_759830 [Peniophora sp. CONT]|nr:hypothetical protein PENSPDRAFT_759830 [Peniophora sp. CONT]
MRLLFHQKGSMRVDLNDAKTKRPVYTLQTHEAVSGTRAVLSKSSQNNDGDEGDDEVGDTTIHEFASDKISVGDVKRVVKTWLIHQDGSSWTFTVSSGTQYTWTQSEEDYLLQGSGGSFEPTRLHTDSTDASKAYLDVNIPKQDQDEVLMSCIYLRLREAKLSDSVDGNSSGPHTKGGSSWGPSYAASVSSDHPHTTTKATGKASKGG